MASIINNNNNNNKDDESKGEDITNNHAEVVVLDPTIVQEMSEMNIVNDDPSFIDILPSGGAGRNIVYTILSMLDMKSVRSLIYSSFIQLFCKNRNDDTLYQLCKDIQHQFKIQLANELKIKYEEEFPKTEYGTPTPIVCACEKGRFEDVKLLITGYNDVNGSNGNNNNMILKGYVNQEGKNSDGYDRTPLMAAAEEEHFQIVKYLIEQGEADPNIADSNGYNALHFAAENNKANIGLIQLLLPHMTLDGINKKGGGYTPLDWAYKYNDSPMKQKIIDLIRSKGGKANGHDENGRVVGPGNGDLNH